MIIFNFHGFPVERAIRNYSQNEDLVLPKSK